MSRAKVPCLAIFLALSTLHLLAAEWHPTLCLDGGGWWRQRVRVRVENGLARAAKGEPVAVKIAADGAACLAGQPAEAIRPCNERGEEMLFAIQGPEGLELTRGPIPAGSTLLLPAECEPRKSAAYYVYFDNPSAGEVPDFLSARLGVVNGDVEQGTGLAPLGWNHDLPDAQHRATWSTEEPQSGKRCLKTVVAAGAEATWIATRQSGIRINGGAKYRMRAWVKAENVRGFAGWYIHVGNQENPMILSPMLRGGDGTFAWKEVSAEFTAPLEADLADLGTVLRGSGTAWFDNASLECLEPSRLSAVAGPAERATLAEVGGDGAWYGTPVAGSPKAAGSWDRRAVVRAFNVSPRAAARALVSVDAAMFDARTPGGEEAKLLVTDSGRPIVAHRLGRLLLLEGDLPAATVRTWHVYWSSDRTGPSGSGPETGVTPLDATQARSNLVKDAGFELDDGASAWTHDAVPADSGIRIASDDPGRPALGKRCARMDVPASAPAAWRGRRQTVPVQAGRTYLLAAWVKCRDIVGGEVRVHAHRLTADGSLSKHDPMTGIGPGIHGTADWTLMSGLIAMPEDTTALTIHLTMNGTGTIWHDGIMLAEVAPARLARIEGRPSAPSAEVAVWPVPAVVKVFPEDAPRQCVEAIRTAAARNEQEPLQLAVRGGRAVQGVSVEVDAPVGPGGAKLSDVEVGVVGYVPIDYPTNYYQYRGPAWRRKVPAQLGECDGWAGRWPDPLLPRRTFDLAANATQPVWLTVSVPKQAAAGDYVGQVRFTAQGKVLAQRAFTVHVWDFTLPDESHVIAKYDLGPGQGAARWGKPWDEMHAEIVAFLAKRRLCADTIRPLPTIRYENGRVTADFSQFDKAAERYFNELKLPCAWMPEFFYLFGWGFPPADRFGESPYPGKSPFEGADRAQLRPEYKKAYQACLRVFWDHVKQKGWEKKFLLYISDEPFDAQPAICEQMKALCRMIHEVDPRIPIFCSTWKHVPDWDGSLDVWGIGHYGIVPPEQIARLRAAGDRVWWTTDGQMCTDTPYCAVERLLPHYCFKYGVEAYEFWGAAWHTYDPYRFGWHAYIPQSDQPGVSYWIRYPNGDGYLLYPGAPIGHAGPVSSIRLEQAREGVEDYEYLHLLRQRIAGGKIAGKDLAAAEQALARAGRLVTIPNAGGRYSSKILPDPEELYRVRELLGETIERLGQE